jgi:hypothetical protein
MQPRQRSFHDPSRLTQPTAMIGVASGQGRCDAAFSQGIAMRLGIVGPVALDTFGTLTRTSALATYRWNGLDQRQQLCDVVRIGAGQRGCQRNARRIRNEVVLAARLAAISRVGACFCPPSTARTLALSTTARDQSIWSATCSRFNSKPCNSSHTPTSCQSRRRRQQVIPQPQPNSCGSISQGIPDRSTNKMPVSASRLPTAIAHDFRTAAGAGIMVPEGGPQDGRAIEAKSEVVQRGV